MGRRSLYDPRDGDRVQRRLSGLTGTVLRCLKKDRSGYYFRVRFDDGTWDWVDDTLIAASAGAYDCRCAECEIAFRSNNIREPLCPNCARRLEAVTDGSPSHGHGGRSWTKRQLRQTGAKE
jgi:hypothetical protein